MDNEAEYPHWNSQSANDIYDSINDWDYHKYVCIMKDDKVCEWRGIQDESYDGEINTYIYPVNDEEYSVDDIVYWTELK